MSKTIKNIKIAKFSRANAQWRDSAPGDSFRALLSSWLVEILQNLVLEACDVTGLFLNA